MNSIIRLGECLAQFVPSKRSCVPKQCNTSHVNKKMMILFYKNATHTDQKKSIIVWFYVLCYSFGTWIKCVCPLNCRVDLFVFVSTIYNYMFCLFCVLFSCVYAAGLYLIILRFVCMCIYYCCILGVFVCCLNVVSYPNLNCIVLCMCVPFNLATPNIY